MLARPGHPWLGGLGGQGLLQGLGVVFREWKGPLVYLGARLPGQARDTFHTVPQGPLPSPSLETDDSAVK